MGVPPMLPAWHGRLAHAPRVAWASRPCSPCGTGVSPMLPDGTGVPPTKGADYELIQQRQGACLPHWTRDEAAYAVNFRLADSMPQSVLEAWQNEREEIVKRAAAKGRQLTRQEQEDLDALYSEKVQAYLDAGHGDCHLRRPEVAAIVADALKHFDGIRYQLLAWCIMPNHVHLVVRPSAEFELSKSLHSLKSFTAHKANELLGREGPFWQSEYYDHLIRDEEDLWHSIEYAWKNPDKAGLQEWKWREKINWQEYEEQSQEHGRDAHATQQEHGRDAHATLILCGERATDGDTGQVGPAIAAWLDLPVVTYVSSIDPADGFVRVRRLVENGHEVLEADTPAVLTVVKEIGDPRLPTLAGKLRAKSLEIPVWTAADLDVDPARLGLAGSPTRVVKIFKPKVARQCQKLPAGDDASAARAVEQLVQLLRQRELIP
ncbi:MAG: transposase [Planctomycetaceae bacterium]